MNKTSSQFNREKMCWLPYYQESIQIRAQFTGGLPIDVKGDGAGVVREIFIYAVEHTSCWWNLILPRISTQNRGFGDLLKANEHVPSTTLKGQIRRKQCLQWKHELPKLNYLRLRVVSSLGISGWIVCHSIHASTATWEARCSSRW
jgi:hypothetical protein